MMLVLMNIKTEDVVDDGDGVDYVDVMRFMLMMLLVMIIKFHLHPA